VLVTDHEIQVGGHPCPIRRCGWPRDTGPRGGGTSDTTTTVPSLTHGQRKRLKVVADNITRPRAGGAGHGGVSGEAHTRCDDEVLDRRGGVGTYAVLELVLRGQLGSPSKRSISAPVAFFRWHQLRQLPRKSFVGALRLVTVHGASMGRVSVFAAGCRIFFHFWGRIV
jgi:hypothetical protein